MRLQTSSPREPPGASVLVVEDDDLAREGLVRLIQALGVGARAARDGEEALQLVLEIQPALILCDLQMPRLDGFGFLKRLRRTLPFHRILIVAVTGLSGPLDFAATREAGFDDHLVKPISAEMLARVLERVGTLGNGGKSSDPQAPTAPGRQTASGGRSDARSA